MFFLDVLFCSLFLVLCSSKYKVLSTKNRFIAPLFSTTTPAPSRSAVRPPARAAPHASLPADGPTRNTPTPHCSSPRRYSAAPVRAPPEIRSTLEDNS